MTSLALLAGAIVAVLVFGLHMEFVHALILTAFILIVLVGRGVFTRPTRKVVIVQDLDTGQTEYQPMDAATQAYLRNRENKMEGDN